MILVSPARRRLRDEARIFPCSGINSTVGGLRRTVAIASWLSDTERPATAASGSPQAVSVIAVESQKLDTTLALPAQIVPYETVDVYPKVTGFIDVIHVDRGSRVRAGEVIIRLSAPELVAQRAQSEANLQAARRSCRQRKRSLPLTRELTSICLRLQRRPEWSQATTCWLRNRVQPRIVHRQTQLQTTSGLRKMPCAA